MSRPVLEVADIFRGHGPTWRRANAGHVSLGQLKVMSAIESCRTAALGGHVARCEKCAHTLIAYNSCRNRHCPKCQGAAAKEWLAERAAELLPVPYYHVVFTLPASISDIANQNKAVIYDILFKASAETLITIAADPKHLGARVGVTSVLHTWGSAMTHHPHIHMIVPGGGLSLDGKRWVSCRPGFFLPVRVLSRLFRRLFLEKLMAAHAAGRLNLFGSHTPLANAQAFAAYRRAQIPIACAAPSHVPTPRFPPLEVFVRRPPQPAAPSPAAGIRKPSHNRKSGFLAQSHPRMGHRFCSRPRLFDEELGDWSHRAVLEDNEIHRPPFDRELDRQDLER